MKEFEYFIPHHNIWLTLSLEAYLSLLFPEEESKFTKIKIPKGLPLSLKDAHSQKIPESMLLPGNYIEVKMVENLFLEINKKNGRIQLISNSNKSGYNTQYEAWSRAKIISYDDNSKLLFVEINDNIEIIDNLDLIRPLKEIKYINTDLLAYNIKQIQKNEYERIKNELNKIFNSNDEDDLSKIYEIKYDNNNNTLALIGNRENLRNISILKQYEERHKKNISEEPYTNSDFSNPNSNKNLIGIKTPSRHSETSENNSNKNIILEKEIIDEINSYKFKQSYTYRYKFKKDLEKELEDLIQNCKYYIGKTKDNNFDITLYGNDEQDFIEEKKIFEKQYKQVVLDLDVYVDPNEINDLAMKFKIKFKNIEKKYLCLVGEEKNINNFIAVWNMTKKYSQEIQKQSMENESIQKELMTFKKKHKYKK